MTIAARINPNRVPWNVWTFSRLGMVALRCGASDAHVCKWVSRANFYSSALGWMLCQPVEFARGQRAALAQGESEQLRPDSSARDRALFYFSFAIAVLIGCWHFPGLVLAHVFEMRRQWKARDREAING